MAKKGILRDTNNVEILPVTRGELVLDSSGKEALRSKEFLATDSWPGLMSSEDKEKLNTLTKIDVDSELKLDSENPAQNKIITAALENKADISDNLVLAEGMKNTEGVTFNLPNSSDEETQVLATQDDILRIVANSDEVYVGDEIPEEDDSIKVWIDTDAGFDYSGNIIEAANGASIYTVYAVDNLSEEQQAFNKKAFESIISGEEAVYYVSISEKAYITSYTSYNNNTAIFACSDVTVTSDGGNLMSAVVSVNEDGSIANLTFQEGSVPNLEYINSILDSKGASIPVVSSEEELENLSQNKGELAIVLSEDSQADTAVPVLDLYQASSEDMDVAITGGGFNMCDRVDGIVIDTDVNVPPCVPLMGVTVHGIIVHKDFPTVQTGVELTFALTEDGLPNSIMCSDMAGSFSELIIANYNTATQKMIAVEEALETVNSFIASIGEAVWVYFYWNNGDSSVMDAETETALKATLAFIKGSFTVVKPGIKSLRIKDTDHYSRFDSDIVKIVDKDLVKSLNALNMPAGSMVRVYMPESIEYDIDWFTLRIPANSDPSNASIVNKIELKHPSDTQYYLPNILLTNSTGDKRCLILWSWNSTSETNTVGLLLPHLETGYILYENGSWNEENLRYIDEAIADGINIFGQASVGSIDFYETTTGEPVADMIGAAAFYLSPYVTLFCNEKTLPERVDVYDKLSTRWKKREEGGPSSGGGASVTVDDAMSDTSGNPVKNSVIKVYIDDTVKTKQDIISDLDVIRTGASDGTAARAEVQSLSEEIVNNEAVTAAALSDLNARIIDIIARLDSAGL